MGRKKKIFKDAVDKKQQKKRNDEGLTFTEALRSFQTRNVAKNLSEKTQKWYTEEITMLGHWLEEKNYSTKVSQISYDVLLQYILFLSTEKRGHNGKKLKPATINAHIRAIKAFFSFLEKSGFIDSNPAKGMERQQEPKYTIKPLSDRQVELLLKIPDLRFFHGHRDYALMVLLLDTGLRISEAVSLVVRDLDIYNKNPNIYVLGKGAKERQIFISTKTQKVLKEYIETYFIDKSNIIPLFCDEGGDALTPKGASKRLAKYAEKIGAEKSSAHVFRHTFAIKFLSNGGDVKSLQKILGHETPRTTFVYLNAQNEHIKKAHQKASPVDSYNFI